MELRALHWFRRSKVLFKKAVELLGSAVFSEPKSRLDETTIDIEAYLAEMELLDNDTEFFSMGATTGRISCSQPNLSASSPREDEEP